MDILSGVIDYVLNDLGSTVTLSILMLLLGLIVGMKPVKAISAAVMFGVGFSAMSLVIEYMTNAISPAAEAMTESVGKSFEIVDGVAVGVFAIPTAKSDKRHHVCDRTDKDAQCRPLERVGQGLYGTCC